MARKPKSLARKNKIGCGCPGNASAPPEYRFAVKPTSSGRNRTMNRDDVLFWLLLAWIAALCGAAIWVLFGPANSIFGF
jgi:hypothetical protein